MSQYYENKRIERNLNVVKTFFPRRHKNYFSDKELEGGDLNAKRNNKFFKKNRVEDIRRAVAILRYMNYKPNEEK